MNYTNLNDAFDFSTTIPNNTSIIKSKFSHDCIYCKHNYSYPLLNDGSFRRCLRCNKEFQAQILPPSLPVQSPPPLPKTSTQFRFNQRQLLEQKNFINDKTPDQPPAPFQQNIPTHFSQPNYDTYIKRS